MRARVALVLAVAASSPLAAQSTRIMPGDAKAMIVRVTSTFASGRVEPGSGIVVGATQDSLYVVTAWHVVATSRDTASTVRVTFFPGDSGDAPGQVSHLGSPSFDVAVVAVPRDSARRFTIPPLDRLGSSVNLRFGDPVRPAGCPNGTCWTNLADPDRVIGTDRHGVSIQSDAVKPGSSGGALFDAYWELVGLVTELDPPRADAVAIERVMEQLAFWHVPTTLRRAALPRAGYRNTLGGQLFASTPTGFNRLPAGRGSFEHRTGSLFAWHVGAMRFAPADLSLWALTAGVGLELRRGRMSAHPFAELGLATTEARYDLGGYYVTNTAADTSYVPAWRRVTGTSLGGGLGLDLRYVILPGIVADATVGRWTFPSPSPVPGVATTQCALGVRLAR